MTPEERADMRQRLSGSGRSYGYLLSSGRLIGYREMLDALDAAEAKGAALTAENAKLRDELRRRTFGTYPGL